MGLLMMIALYSVSLIIPTFSFNPKTLSHADVIHNSSWNEGLITWYGDSHGAGSDGGACGYETSVSTKPLSSMIAAAYPDLYLNGQGCGACFQIRCLQTIQKSCSGNPITITITDLCEECGKGHFDLSGTAFGELSVFGQADNLRGLGQLKIQYQRVVCNYGSTKLEFKMDSGANNYDLIVHIELEDGNGEIVAVKLIDDENKVYEMQRNWGVVWSCNLSNGAKPPFSFNVTDDSGNTISATGVIPINWVPGNTYTATINFNN